MKKWLYEQWKDIRGNVKWAVLVLVGGGVVTGVVALTHGLALWQQVCLSASFVFMLSWAIVATAYATVGRKSKFAAEGSSDTPRSGIVTQRIAFDYLPESPLVRGWKTAYAFNNATPAFSPIHANSETCLNMIVGETFAMDYSIARNAQTSKRITLSVIYHQENAMLFFEFKLKSENGKPEFRWVKIEPGNLAPEITKDYPNEYTLYLQGTPQPEGWALLDVSLPDDVIKHTWLRDGLHFEAIKRVRIRGSLSISPILLRTS